MIPVVTRRDNEGELPVTVRRAIPDDAAELAALRHAFRAPRAPNVEAADTFLHRCQAWMRPRLTGDSIWRAWIAERDGRTLGAIWLQLVEKLPNPVDEPESHAYISNLFVQEAARGLGLGSALLSAALDECRRLEVDTVILWPTPRSRSLYARFGFVVSDAILAATMTSNPNDRRNR